MPATMMTDRYPALCFSENVCSPQHSGKNNEAMFDLTDRQCLLGQGDHVDNAGRP